MTLFSLFLGVQSAPEVGPTSYETACINYFLVGLTKTYLKYNIIAIERFNDNC